MIRQITYQRLTVLAFVLLLVGQTAGAATLDDILKSLTNEDAMPKAKTGELLIDDGAGGKNLMPRTKLKDNLLDETNYVYKHEKQRDPMVLHWTKYQETAKEKLTQANKELSSGDLEAAEKSFNYVIALNDESKEKGYTIKEMPNFVNQAIIGLVRIKLKNAQIILKNGDLEAARNQFQSIRIDANNLRNLGLDGKILDDIVKEVESGLNNIQRQLNVGAPGTGLPQWVKDNIKGVIIGGDSPYVLLGEFTLGEGELIPDSANLEVEVKVFDIQKDYVVFHIEELKKLEKVPVSGQ